MTELLDRDLGFDRIESIFVKGGRVSADVGVFDEEIAEYAVVHEFGSETIPASMVMRRAFDTNVDSYLVEFDQGLKGVIAGTASLDGVLVEVARGVAADIEDAISDDDLIDTGALISSIDFRIV